MGFIPRRWRSEAGVNLGSEELAAEVMAADLRAGALRVGAKMQDGTPSAEGMFPRVMRRIGLGRFLNRVS